MQKALKKWLESQVLAYELKLESLIIAAKKHLSSLSIEPPTQERLEKLVRSAIRNFEENFFKRICPKIPPSTREKLDQLLVTSSDDSLELEAENEENNPLNSPQKKSTNNYPHSHNKCQLQWFFRAFGD